MKIYARQVPPEYQESPLMLCGEFWDGIICEGNRDYKSRTTDEYDQIKRNMEEAAAEIEELIKKTGYSAYKTITEAVHDLLYRENKKRYTTKEIHKWKELLRYYQTCKKQDEYRAICEALELMTGKSYSYCCIRGCCQSDWQYIYYPNDGYSDESIKCFEAEYFNTGSEWLIHDGETEPKTYEDIDGYHVYCYSWNDDGLRKEIADTAGGKPEDVILYQFRRYRKIPVYEVI